jgi:hypothetical protein
MKKKYNTPLNASDYYNMSAPFLNEGIFKHMVDKRLEGMDEEITDAEREGESAEEEKPFSKVEERAAVKNLIKYMMSAVKDMKMFADKLSGMDEYIKDFYVDFELDKGKINDNLIESMMERLKEFKGNQDKLKNIINDLRISGEIFLKFLARVYGKK